MVPRKFLFEYIKSTLVTVSTAILTVLFLPVLLLGLIFVAPIHVFRFIVSKLSRLVRPDLGSILPLTSSLTGVDDTYNCPKCAVFGIFVLEGDLSLDNLKDKMRPILELRDKNGSLCYPEFVQSITSWMGFLFWKWDKKFDLKQHIGYYNEQSDNIDSQGNVITEGELAKIAATIIQKPFLPDSSPWEVLVIRNFKPKNAPPDSTHYHSIIFMRFSHALGDGYSVYKLVTRHLSNDPENAGTTPEPKAFKKVSIVQKALFQILAVLKIPLALMSIHHPMDRNHSWRKCERELSGKLNFEVGNSMDLVSLKDIKKQLNVSLYSVILSAIGGGIRRMMLDQGFQVPEFIKVSCPFPMPGHPEEKMSNHMAVCFLNIPIGEANPFQRLKLVDAEFKSISFSTVPLSLFYISKIVGGLFTWMIKPLAKFKINTGLISNLPGSEKPFEMVGHNVTDWYFNGGLLNGEMGFAFTTPSFAGKMRVTLVADECIVRDDDEMRKLLAFVEDEFQILKSGVDV